MSSEIRLDIVTPEKLAFSGTVAQVVVPAWNGQYGVLPDHDNFLGLLKPGIVTVFDPSGEVRYVVGRGFVEVVDRDDSVNATRVSVLAESCELATSVDKAKAQAEHTAAEQAMAEAESPERAELARARLELAQARLEA